MKRINWLLVVILSVSLFSNGCIERRLFVKSNPPGAKVYFDNNYMGETPIDFEFEWYWKHRVKLEKKGYKKINNLEKIKAPPYMWMPLDLLIELLPFKIKDYRSLNYTLKSIEAEDNEEIIEEDITIKEIDFRKEQ